MRSIVFDHDARRSLIAQRTSEGGRPEAPLRWHAFVDNLDRRFGGRGADVGGVVDVLSARATLFAWQPTAEAIVAASIRGGLVYLCWGVGKRDAFRRAAFKHILRGARHVLVNDATTLGEVDEIAGRSASLVPFYVDTSYFSYKPTTSRESFVFCNGSNGRDPRLVCELAILGVNVVWLLNDANLRMRFENRYSNLKIVSNITYENLRTLYQKCAVNIMPSTNDLHCAGQTTGMEAISCGSPLIISPGRTASIFNGISTVEVLSTNETSEWIDKIKQITSLSNDNERKLSRGVIVDRCSTDNMIRALSPIFGWNEFAASESP